jgi:serine/threonine-protein kinase
MDAARSPVQPGDIVAGKYRIESILGAGGMGVVVVATHLELLETRAIKFMLPEALTNADAVERFVREARAASLLKSEHVARVFDVGRLETGAPYMVMEHLEGTDLDVVLRSRGQLPVGEGVLYILQAAEALAEAHGRGIIHRDLKPSNLFIAARANGSPCVKVLDFGISKIIGAVGADVDLTKEHTVLGSPHYMSPEQMRSSRDVDGRSDIWSLGVILYMILAAQRPFRGHHVGEIIARVMASKPAPPSRHRRELPPELDAVIMRCLERTPSARFADVSELAKALLPFAPEGSARLVEGIARIVISPGRTAASLSAVQLSESQRLAAATPMRTPVPEPEATRDSEPEPDPEADLDTAIATPAAIRQAPPESVAPPSVTGAWGGTASRLAAPRPSRLPLIAAFAVTGLLGALIAWGFTREGGAAKPGVHAASSAPASSLAASARELAPLPSIASAPVEPASSASSAPSASAAPSAKKREIRVVDPFGMERK